MYDVVIINGRVVDGTGSPSVKADVAIENERIVKVGKLDHESADFKIDGFGRVIAPGFIDMHSHSDLTLLASPFSYCKVFQGITTEVVGNCGVSLAPLDRRRLQDVQTFVSSFLLGQSLPWDWSSLEEFFQALERTKIGVNIVQLIGHGTVRTSVMGFQSAQPSDKELEDMKNLVMRGMRDGAAGMSTGLKYMPGSLADIKELAELAKVVSKFQGIYTSHMRDEGDTLLESITETVNVGERAHLPTHVSHLKVIGRRNWGRSLQALNLIEEARRRGLDVTADQYPYPAGSTLLRTTLPPWALEGGTEAIMQRLRDKSTRARIKHDIENDTLSSVSDGYRGWENIVASCGFENIVLTHTTHESDRQFEGRSLIEIARATEKDSYDVLFDIILRDTNALMIDFYAQDEDLERIMKHPEVLFCTDMEDVTPGGSVTIGRPHPRAYGSFPRILGRYVREKEVLTLEQAIHKMTLKAAKRVGLADRGIISEGAFADLTVFDPERILDTATFESPHQYPAGISYVIVNGKLAVEKGRHTGVAAGKVLKMRDN